MVRGDSLATAARAVPSERWTQWLKVDAAELSVYGVVPIGPGALVELSSAQDDRRVATLLAWDDGDEGGDPLALHPDGRALVAGEALPDVRDALFDFALRGHSDREGSTEIASQPSGERAPGVIPSSRVVEGVIEYESVASLHLESELRPQEPLDIEVARHLTHAGCPSISRLLAVLTVRDAESEAQRHWGGLLEHWPKTVPGRVAFRAELESHHLTDRARALGATVWQFHQALANDTDSLRFKTREVNAQDIQEWHRELVDTATRSMNGLLRVRDRLDLDSSAAGLEHELPSRLAETLSQGSMLISKVTGAGGRKTRVHGMLDLDALVRRTDGSYLFIDFARGHGRLASPVRDLAQLLHSLSLTLRENDSLREVRAALLNGYFDDEAEQELIPPTPHRLLALVQLFEMIAAYRDLEERIRDRRPCSPALIALHTLTGARP